MLKGAYTIHFQLRLYRMSVLFLEKARTVHFLSSSPLMLRLMLISSMVVLAKYEEVTNTLPVVRFASHKLLVSVHAIVINKLQNSDRYKKTLIFGSLSPQYNSTNLYKKLKRTK